MHWPVPHFQNAVTAGLILGSLLVPAFAQGDPQPLRVQAEAPDAQAPDTQPPEAQDPESRAGRSALETPAAPDEPTAEARLRAREDLDALFAELAQPEGDAWARAEADILRIWSRSGSAAMDLLAKRGEAAMDAGDLDAAIGHLTALTDHAPDYANGWYLRAVAYELSGRTGPAVADLAQTLALEPRHFPALTQLGAILEELGQESQALAAYHASLEINPHQQDAGDSLKRLEASGKGTDA
ncbi:MAG: tetratricopeptide repeat protein [Paracoccus sp. (in: a-proteobacteria)]|uniref:hypothetical protein n=1 Tax=Paracoccus sp. TaxID=267 RepID=UPI0039E21F22